MTETTNDISDIDRKMHGLGTHFKKKHNTRPVHGGIYAMYGKSHQQTSAILTVMSIGDLCPTIRTRVSLYFIFCHKQSF